MSTTIGTGLIPPLPDQATCPADAQNSTIQRNKEWAAQKRAEADLKKRVQGEHFSELKGFYRTFCHKCSIGIGPAQIERSLYFYPIVNVGIYLYDDEKCDEYGSDIAPKKRTDVLRLCGSCAQELHLPLERRVIAPSDWTTPPLSLASLTLIDFYEWLYRKWHAVWLQEMPPSVPCTIKEVTFIGSVKTIEEAAPARRAPVAQVIAQPVPARPASSSRLDRLVGNVQRVGALTRKVLNAQPVPSFSVS